jgi:GPH family glycoside/pentoside/hexuronide:cation symporter
VQLGTFRFIFATCANLFVANMTTRMVQYFGADAAAWRTVAIIYAVIGIVVNTISVLSGKELPESELADEKAPAEAPQKNTLIDTLKTLLVNPYFDMLTMIYVMGYLSVSVSLGAAVYYFTYVTGDVNMYGNFMTMYSIPSVVGLIVVPFLVDKCKSIRTVNLVSFVIQCIFRVVFLFATIEKNIPVMLVLFGLCSLTNCSMMGTFNALVAEASEFTRHKTGKQLDGSMYSCTSFGMKVGSGIGSGLMGWLLAASGFSQELTVQSTACNNMLIFMFAGVPIIVTVATTIIYFFLKVEAKNKALRAN